MTQQLSLGYDERDFLQIWNPVLNSIFSPDFEPGRYEMFSSVKLKGVNRAFDSIMIDDFSKIYPDILAEVKRKEPLVEQENYEVPELGLHRVQLSRILEEIYYRFVEKKAFTQKQAESVI